MNNYSYDIISGDQQKQRRRNCGFDNRSMGSIGHDYNENDDTKLLMDVHQMI